MPIDLKQSSQGRPGRTLSQDQRIDEYFQKKDAPVQTNDLERKYEEPQLSNIGEIIHQWQAPEFEIYEKSGRWYLGFAIFIIAIVAYALITNSPIMAITFILLGAVGYIHLQKDPRDIIFSITSEGVVADKELYSYDNIKSFWIHYDPPQDKILTLHTNASMLPSVNIPLGDEDPVVVRDILVQYTTEIKQDPSIINTLEKIFHI